DRVEDWSIEEQQQQNSYELHIPRSCMQSELSPTGDYLACVQLAEGDKFPMQLALIEVSSGDQVWVRKGVIDPTLSDLWAMIMGVELRMQLEFSPDGRY